MLSRAAASLHADGGWGMGGQGGQVGEGRCIWFVFSSHHLIVSISSTRLCPRCRTSPTEPAPGQIHIINMRLIFTESGTRF